ncbi:hypothetical protein EG68_02161 [Paragonimus skrjabini miyazakii]|uniref:Uncharacterized protein n=1 Tax=Paragonimus skrjabini miyazakii TaxID=59628 RepID=A0A8S9YYZ8_9TREM|nr:hypothetical protein EG68_02161 [Paragonimus skrjabini miyazakii]
MISGECQMHCVFPLTIASINVTQVGCSYSRKTSNISLKILAGCYYNHPTGNISTVPDYPVGEQHNCRHEENGTNTANDGCNHLHSSSSIGGWSFTFSMFRLHWCVKLFILSSYLYCV